MDEKKHQPPTQPVPIFSWEFFQLKELTDDQIVRMNEIYMSHTESLAQQLRCIENE